MRGDNDLPLRCLKVGYAKNVEERLKAYKTYNPSVKLLKTREGDYELENYLHKYFKKYELPNFNEWFIFSKKIIEEFELIEIQEDTITVDEYLECIRKDILYKLIPETYEKVFCKVPELLIDLEAEFNGGLYDGLYSSFPKDFCKKHVMKILQILRNKELEYFNQTDFSDIRMDFPQIMGRQRLRENKFKDECLFIYKLSDESITTKEYDELSKKKLKGTLSDISIFNAVKTSMDENTKTEKILSDIRLRVRVQKYSEDYTGINEKTGKPVINKLVMISERRAFELRSNIYKSDVQAHNEFANLSSELSTELALERNNEILNQRSLYKSNGSFETKMKSVCDFLLNPKWFDHINISDLYWLPLNMRNYIIQLGPQRIKEIGCREIDIRKEITNVTSGDRIKTVFSELFIIGEKYSLKQIKEIISVVYSDLMISKTAKATDLEDYFNIRKCTINLKDGKRINGYEILSLKP